MTEEEIPDESLNPHHVFAMETTCRQTPGGWLWFCGDHHAHGTADARSEAESVADAHRDWWQSVAVVNFVDEFGRHPREDELDDDLCDIVIWCRTQHERL